MPVRDKFQNGDYHAEQIIFAFKNIKVFDYQPTCDIDRSGLMLFYM